MKKVLLAMALVASFSTAASASPEGLQNSFYYFGGCCAPRPACQPCCPCPSPLGFLQNNCYEPICNPNRDPCSSCNNCRCL